MRAPARVTLLADPASGPVTATGPVTSVQEAEIELPADAFHELWRAHHLERLARAYWRFLSKATLGLVRVVYAPDSRTVVLLTRSLPLLRFRRPDYAAGRGVGQVTWRIERGLLVARSGRGRGFLRITVRALEAGPELARLRVSCEVASFYPALRGGGRFARLGALLYSATQLRIHVWVTRGFLRSLERFDIIASSMDELAGPRPLGRP
ncbi:MAG TPA: hypothetical protein VIL04_06885 [Solirubrobacterales bacterium]